MAFWSTRFWSGLCYKFGSCFGFSLRKRPAGLEYTEEPVSFSQSSPTVCPRSSGFVGCQCLALQDRLELRWSFVF